MGTIFVDNIKNNVGGKKLNIGDNSVNVDDAGAVTINEGSVDADFRVESNGNANMLVVNAGDDRVGIGTNAPASPLHISGSNGVLATLGATTDADYTAGKLLIELFGYEA